ncbi:MAG TPA: FkbM family methyltransferase [Gaiellaceae bacterium]|nr:FkbM family methyltransferase [Gaiellaceae bacterium]
MAEDGEVEHNPDHIEGYAPGVLIRNKRVRSLGRVLPGASPLYHAVMKWFLIRRGVARIDYPGADIRIRSNSEEIVHLRLRPLAKEPWTVEWIEENLRDGDVLYDIGANVGDYALIAAAIGGPATKVVAIEPGYATYASLCENVQLNDLGDKVIPLPIVLGEAVRLGSLSYRDTSAGGAMHTMDGSGGAYDQPVLVFPLDELPSRFGLPGPTLIKLDVDGAEAAVLAGGAETLRRPELRSVLIEIEEDRADEVLGHVERAGLTLRRRFDERYGEQLPGVWYGIFER